MRAIIGIAGTAFLFVTFANVAGSDAPSEPRAFTVAENAEPGAEIGQLPTTGAIASPAITYSVAHDGHSIPFVIDPHSGTITLADSPLDFERQSQHDFTVRSRRPRALDAARRAYLADLLASGVDPETIDELLFEVAEQVVTVNVTDSPEPPVLSSPTALRLVIDDSGIAASAPLVTHDPDSGDVHTFEIIADDSRQLQIDPQTGRLTRSEAAALIAGRFPVTVRVTDRAGLSHAATFDVEIVVPPPAAVAATLPEILPEVPAPTVELFEPAVSNLPAPVIEDAESESTAPESIVVAPATVIVDIESIEPEAPIEPEPEIAIAPPVETIASPTVATAAPQNLAAVNVPVKAAASSPAMSLVRWLPLLCTLFTAGLAGVWYWRRRPSRQLETATAPFRVVREAQVAEVVPVKNTGDPRQISDEDLTKLRLLGLETDAADQAAVHQLIASAFQQASGVAALSMPPPAPSVEAELRSVAVRPVASTDEPLVDVDAIAEASAVETRVPFVEQDPQSAFPDPLRVAEHRTEVADAEPGFGTEPHALPAPAFGGDVEEPLPASDLQHELAAHEARQMATMDGYGAVDEELGGGYSGLRLSQSSGPAPQDDPEPQDYGPTETTDVADSGLNADAPPADEDPKLQDLRRQLSDLFGVPADRPRSIAPPVAEFDPDEIDAASEHRAAEPPTPAPVALPSIAEETNASAPIQPPAAAAQPAPASDPVNSWLEYLKQRALEKPGTATAYPAPSAAPQVPPVPSKPALSAVSAVTAQRSTTPHPVRPNKSAVREEITLLRDVANRHSRNVLARRALNQRARITWVLWGTALIVLCFSGLWGVQHDAGGIRTLGWALLGGAAIALAGCSYGLRSLTRPPVRSMDDEELDGATAADDLEASTAPELMTPEMEQRLREVLEEARNVPETAQSRS